MTLVATNHYQLSGGMLPNANPPIFDPAYTNGDRPLPGAMTIDWDGVNGFGLARNIIYLVNSAYFDRVNVGDPFELVPAGPGRIGTFVNDTVSLPVPAIGELTPGGHKGWNMHEPGEPTQRKILIEGIYDFKGHHSRIAVATPKNKLFPGHNTNEFGVQPLTYGQFPLDSGCKIAWFLFGPEANDVSWELDFVAFQHSGNGIFSVSGNSTSPVGQFGNGNDIYAFSQVADGELGNINYLGLIITADVTNCVTNATDQTVMWTSPKISAGKATGTLITTISKAFAHNQGAGDVVHGIDDYVTEVDFAALNRKYPNDPDATQMTVCEMYLAIPSSPGAEDWKQNLYACNASTLTAATRCEAWESTTWSNTQVTTNPPWWATHMIIRNAAGHETPKPVVI